MSDRAEWLAWRRGGIGGGNTDKGARHDPHDLPHMPRHPHHLAPPHMPLRAPTPPARRRDARVPRLPQRVGTMPGRQGPPPHRPTHQTNSHIARTDKEHTMTAEHVAQLQAPPILKPEQAAIRRMFADARRRLDRRGEQFARRVIARTGGPS